MAFYKNKYRIYKPKIQAKACNGLVKELANVFSILKSVGSKKTSFRQVMILQSKIIIEPESRSSNFDNGGFRPERRNKSVRR
jgi:hypothetical protein